MTLFPKQEKNINQHEPEALAKIERVSSHAALGRSNSEVSPLECPCRASDFVPVHLYTAPSPGEFRFTSSSTTCFRRELFRCRACSHFISVHLFDAQDIYGGDYVNSIYEGATGLLKSYERIMALSPDKSDNVGRVNRVLNFAKNRFQTLDDLVQAADIKLDRVETATPPTVLDVGSGLCVFLAQLKEHGWKGTALDPDARAVMHARQNVGVEAVCGTFETVTDLPRFDVVTLNKVIEHVYDPVALLRISRDHIKKGGFVYIEVPDGELAWDEGPGRNEFFIEHLHIYSAASLALTVQSAGLRLLAMERLREPSGKFTLRAFAE